MTPKVRQLLYTIGVVVFAGLAVLSTFKIIDPNTAATVSAALTTILGLFGVTVSGTAAWNVTKQQKGGHFDPVAPVAPEDQIVNGLNELQAQKAAVDAAVERAKGALSSAVKDVPVLGPLAQQAIDALP
jgi:hypothetical protein